MGEYTALLVATDSAGAEVDVFNWTFAIRPAPKFQFSDAGLRNFTRIGLGAPEVSPAALGAANNTYAANATYILAAPHFSKDELFQGHKGSDRYTEGYRDDSADTITYSVTTFRNGSDGAKQSPSSAGDFFVDASGKILAWPKGVGDYVGILKARDLSGQEVVVRQWQFHIRVRDTDLSAYGPGGEDCKNGAEKIDGTEFDEGYTCACVEGFEGDNCQHKRNDAEAEATGAIEIAGTLGAVLLLVGFAAAGAKLRRWWAARQPVDFKAKLHGMAENGELGELVNFAGSLLVTPEEVPRGSVTLIETIASGNFGTVMKAKLRHPNIPGGLTVAAKVLKAKSEDASSELYHEAIVTAQLGAHAHVVELLGVVTVGHPEMLLVSYCEHGSLLNQLRSRAERNDPFSRTAKLTFGLEVCRGMAYLASKQFVHRDLAARNVLVDVDWHVKVADFGLSRATERTSSLTQGEGEASYYRCRAATQIPVRWTALEAMQDLRYTEASDCWSFGILVAEVFMDGRTPYPGVKETQELPHLLRSGVRMSEHDVGCGDRLHTILAECWDADPSSRPTFEQLVSRFDVLLCAPGVGVGLAAPANGTLLDGGPARAAALGLCGTQDSSKSSVHTYWYCDVIPHDARPSGTQTNARSAPNIAPRGVATGIAEPIGTSMGAGRGRPPSRAAAAAGAAQCPGFEPEPKSYGWVKPPDVVTIYEPVGRPILVGDYMYAATRQHTGMPRGGSTAPAEYSASVPVAEAAQMLARGTKGPNMAAAASPGPPGQRVTRKSSRSPAAQPLDDHYAYAVRTAPVPGSHAQPRRQAASTPALDSQTVGHGPGHVARHIVLARDGQPCVLAADPNFPKEESAETGRHTHTTVV